MADANEKLLKDLEKEVVMSDSDDISIGNVFESHLTVGFLTPFLSF